MPKRKPKRIYEVWQGSTLICSREMGLSASEARGKVENERRRGNFMTAKPTNHHAVRTKR